MNNSSVNSDSNGENRCFPRINVVAKVRYRVLGQNIKNEAKSKNISIGGICITSKRPIAKNGIVEITFILPNDMNIEARGRVVWCNEIPFSGEYEMGIEFIKILGSHMDELKKHIIE